MWKVQLFKLNFDDLEADAVREVVKSGWITMGEQTARFEASFSEFLHGAHCIATSSCTAALHMALLALDIGPGDEVIIPALTFVADANVVRMVSATPVLADCGSLSNWNVTAETIEQAISSKTKAVIIVHYAGYPCDMAAIIALCRSRGIHLIEDVAHAPGASIDGKCCGTWGDIGCFSFFTNKNLSVGEGGMVTTLDNELNLRLRHLRSHGMTSLTFDRHQGRANTYDVARPGLNFRLDEMRAALGIVQLGKLTAANRRRRELTELYHRNFSGSKVTIPFNDTPPDHVSAYHILPTLLPTGSNRTEVMEFLKARGIQSSIHYPPFWGFSAYKEHFQPFDTPRAAEICERELTLPLYPTMKDEEVDMVTTSILEGVA